MRDLSELELPTLGDGDIVLRPWRPQDAPAVAAMCDDETVWRWMPLMPAPYTLADGEEWVGNAERKWREEQWANFAVADPAGELVGSVGVRVDAERDSGELGYLVSRARRRQGIASRAVRLLSAWCFDELELARLQIRADARNVASRRTIETCGYQFEGILRAIELVRGERVDDALYSLLPGDPRPW